MVKKGSIVWYWHEKENQWLKGKVISVNKYNTCSSNFHAGLMVMHRQTKKPYFVPYGHTAFLASEPKPHLEIGDYLRYKALTDRWSFMGNRLTQSAKKLYLKLGIIPKI
jgi:hypothetical protein